MLQRVFGLLRKVVVHVICFFFAPEHNLLQKVMTTCIHTAVLDSMCSLCHMKRFGGVDA